ncbi:hypothetical protein O5D80_007010 [Batrachochytrium dendrobatidis]|nr:hypothetical protein O5D80_007010 [Batrachochytrium dendrobatidis]
MATVMSMLCDDISDSAPVYDDHGNTFDALPAVHSTPTSAFKWIHDNPAIDTKRSDSFFCNMNILDKASQHSPTDTNNQSDDSNMDDNLSTSHHALNTLQMQQFHCHESSSSTQPRLTRTNSLSWVYDDIDLDLHCSTLASASALCAAETGSNPQFTPTHSTSAHAKASHELSILASVESTCFCEQTRALDKRVSHIRIPASKPSNATCTGNEGGKHKTELEQGMDVMRVEKSTDSSPVFALSIVPLAANITPPRDNMPFSSCTSALTQSLQQAHSRVSHMPHFISQDSIHRPSSLLDSCLSTSPRPFICSPKITESTITTTVSNSTLSCPSITHSSSTDSQMTFIYDPSHPTAQSMENSCSTAFSCSQSDLDCAHKSLSTDSHTLVKCRQPQPQRQKLPHLRPLDCSFYEPNYNTHNQPQMTSLSLLSLAALGDLRSMTPSLLSSTPSSALATPKSTSNDGHNLPMAYSPRSEPAELTVSTRFIPDRRLSCAVNTLSNYPSPNSGFYSSEHTPQVSTLPTPSLTPASACLPSSISTLHDLCHAYAYHEQESAAMDEETHSTTRDDNYRNKYSNHYYQYFSTDKEHISCKTPTDKSYSAIQSNTPPASATFPPSKCGWEHTSNPDHYKSFDRQNSEPASPYSHSSSASQREESTYLPSVVLSAYSSTLSSSTDHSFDDVVPTVEAESKLDACPDADTAIKSDDDVSAAVAPVLLSNGKFGCPKCDKSYHRQCDYRSHYRVHQSTRPFECSICTQSFLRRHDLNRHARIHLGLKPFKCSRCGKGFVRKDALRRHLNMDPLVQRFRCALRETTPQL